MDYKKHTKERFKERFLPIISVKKYWLDLTDDDYNKMCDLCRFSPLFKVIEKNKVIIKYNDTYIWCVLTKKKKVIKTIYPIKKYVLRKYFNSL